MDQLTQFVSSHWELCAALVVILGLIVASEMGSTVRGIRQVTPQEAVNLINRENAVVIDTRSEDIYKKGHITGALNIVAAEIKDNLVKLKKYKDKPIIISCVSGQTSINAGVTLKKEGFENVSSLKGGVTAWQSDNLPLVKG